MLIRSMVVAVTCGMVVSVAHAAVYEYQFQTYYDPTACGTASVPRDTTGPEEATLTLKFKQPSSTKSSLDELWLSGDQIGRLTPSGSPASLLVLSPTSVPQLTPNQSCGAVSSLNNTAVVAAQPASETSVTLTNPAGVVFSDPSSSTPSGAVVLSGDLGQPAIETTSFNPGYGFAGMTATLGFEVLTTTTIPEPSTLMLSCLGLVAVASRIQSRCA